MVPPETVLAAQFGVNRHTVRSALASLSEEGIVQARQGQGTMILRRERLAFPISRRTRFSAGLGDQAQSPRTTLLASDRVAAPPEVALALALSPNAACIRLETLGSADGRPISNATSYVCAKRFPAMAEKLAEHGSITRAFAAQGLEDYVRVSTEILARHALGEELQVLALSPGAIVLETVALNADLAGVPVQYSRTRFAADRMKLTVES